MRTNVSISCPRTRVYVSRVQQLARSKREQEEEEQREADLKSLKCKLDSDFKVLADLKPSDDDRALSVSKDMKYLRDRQRCFGESCSAFRHSFS